MPHRIGIIGAGGIAQLHAQTAAKVGLEVAAICDIDEDRAKQLAGQYNGAIATNSHATLLEMSDVSAVAIATPTSTHKPLAIAALQAGKDVLLEKPMAIDCGECDEIIDAVQRADRLLQMGFVCRVAPASRAVKRFIDAGRLGRIYHAKATLYRRRGIPGLGRWFTTKRESGGGVLMDLGVHLLDLVLYLTGPPQPTRVCAACTSTFGSPIENYTYDEMWAGPPNPKGVFDVEDAVTALIHFDNGMTLDLDTTWAADLPNGIYRDGVLLLGDKGGCFFDLWSNEVILTAQQDGYLVDTKPSFPPGDAWAAAWQRQYEVFAENLDQRKAPEASATDGRAVQRLLDALYRSAESGCEVQLG